MFPEGLECKNGRVQVGRSILNSSPQSKRGVQDIRVTLIYSYNMGNMSYDGTKKAFSKNTSQSTKRSDFSASDERCITLETLSNARSTEGMDQKR